MKERTKIYTHTIIYMLLSALGFGILNAFGIKYSDPKILYAGIPMMAVIAIYTYRINGNSILLKAEEFKKKSSYLWLNWIPYLVILAFIATFIEGSFVMDKAHKIICAGVLCLLIGFCEEGMFRHFLINEGRKVFPIWVVLLYSTLTFAILHMSNIASGLTVKNALSQSIAALPFGLVAGILYIGTKNISALIFWHMFVDFSLFVGQLASLKTPFIIGILLDIIIITALLRLLINNFKFFKIKRN